MAGTPPGSPSSTGAVASSEEDACTPALPPCRAAAKYVSPCPLCGRRVTLKTLRYAHVCGRNFNEEARAVEQQKIAEAALLARMQQQKRNTEHSQTQLGEHGTENNQQKWQNLFNMSYKR